MAYGALIGGRASMVQDSADFLQMALTIAVRYGAVRRQGEPLTAETHAGQIFTCVGALAIADQLHYIDGDLLGWWLAERQTAHPDDRIVPLLLSLPCSLAG